MRARLTYLRALLDWTRAAYDRDRANFDDRRITMGAHSYGHPRVVTYTGDDRARVRIGAFCSIADGVLFMEGGNHPVDWVSTYPMRVRFGLAGAYRDGHPRDRGDIIVGNDVWIGRDARVLSGVTIGNGAIVAGYSVVTRDVPPYTIVGGNPARVIRQRFSDAQVAQLEAIAWWTWPLEQILAHVDLLNASDIEGFLQAARRRDSASVVGRPSTETP